MNTELPIAYEQSKEVPMEEKPVASVWQQVSVCDECGYRAKNNTALQMHKRRKHGDLRGAPQHMVARKKKANQWQTGTPKPCQICGFKSDTRLGMGIHKRKKHGIKGQSRTDPNYWRIRLDRRAKAQAEKSLKASKNAKARWARVKGIEPFVYSNEMEKSISPLTPTGKMTERIIELVAEKIARQIMEKI